MIQSRPILSLVTVTLIYYAPFNVNHVGLYTRATKRPVTLSRRGVVRVTFLRTFFPFLPFLLYFPAIVHITSYPLNHVGDYRRFLFT